MADHSHSTSDSALHVVVVTPEATVLDTSADFVALPLFDGEFGIAPQHSPMIGRLGYGELRIRRRADVDRYYVDGGFVQVADNVVSVLTNRAIPADAARCGTRHRKSSHRNTPARQRGRKNSPSASG